MPANAGIQPTKRSRVPRLLDSRFRGNDSDSNLFLARHAAESQIARSPAETSVLNNWDIKAEFFVKPPPHVAQPGLNKSMIQINGYRLDDT